MRAIFGEWSFQPGKQASYSNVLIDPLHFDRILGSASTGSRLGVVPDDCKNGAMGNRNLYHFCLAILIFLDITVPLALLAVAIKSQLNNTLTFCPAVAVPAAPVKEEIIVPEKPEEKLAPPPATAISMFIGQA